jgi:hypothetical protein
MLSKEEIDKIRHEVLNSRAFTEKEAQNALIQAGAEAERAKLTTPDEQMVEIVAENLFNQEYSAIKDHYKWHELENSGVGFKAIHTICIENARQLLSQLTPIIGARKQGAYNKGYKDAQLEIRKPRYDIDKYYKEWR